MKKWLKIWLIVWWSLLVIWWAWAWLTKAWVIPNWFDIEILCPWISCIDCEWKSFLGKSVYLVPPQLDWQPCCEWTYKYEINKYIDDYWCDSEWYCSYKPINIDDYWCDSEWYCSYKPIIYLYPTIETKVNVKLWTPKNLSHTYPKYNWEKWWNVIAQPNGDLEDIDTWRKLYALYREWKSDNETNFDEWFVVAWKDIIPFLEEKLAILWLNEREAEEFIVYWLPQMENNAYNLIRFETIEEQDENMPLNITPAPDTVIRVMMDWKAIDEPIDIPEQQLVTPERTWFTVVERWWSPRN